MKPATRARSRAEPRRLLLIDPARRRFAERAFDLLSEILRPGDVLVLNDAATLPASLHTVDGAVELRLLGREDTGAFEALAFGAGDWRLRTEDRPRPPPLREGARLTFAGGLTARIVATGSERTGGGAEDIRHRWVRLRFEASEAALWPALYRAGRAIQYSYLAAPLQLWDVQTVYASRPWAAEAPSAGLALRWEHLLALRRRDVRWAWLTHAAGISSTGDARLDAELPRRERFEIPRRTVDLIETARAAGGRVIAVGTTVVRALEGCAANHGGALVAGSGSTDLRIDASFRRRVVDGLLTGMHERGESHFELLQAFAPRGLLEEANHFADTQGFLTHEFGDSALLLPRVLQSSADSSRAAG